MVERGVEVDQPMHSVRIGAGEGGKLVARDRVTHQRDLVEMQRVEHQPEVFDPAGDVVAARWLAGRAVNLGG